MSSIFNKTYSEEDFCNFESELMKVDIKGASELLYEKYMGDFNFIVSLYRYDFKNNCRISKLYYGSRITILITWFDPIINLRYSRKYYLPVMFDDKNIIGDTLHPNFLEKFYNHPEYKITVNSLPIESKILCKTEVSTIYDRELGRLKIFIPL